MHNSRKHKLDFIFGFLELVLVDDCHCETEARSLQKKWVRRIFLSICTISNFFIAEVAKK